MNAQQQQPRDPAQEEQAAACAAAQMAEEAVDCADGRDDAAAPQPAACPGLDEAIQELQVCASAWLL